MHQGVGNRKPEASTVNSKAILTTQAQNSLQASLGGGGGRGGVGAKEGKGG